jgi:hypothetical protein
LWVGPPAPQNCTQQFVRTIREHPSSSAAATSRIVPGSSCPIHFKITIVAFILITMGGWVLQVTQVARWTPTRNRPWVRCRSDFYNQILFAHINACYFIILCFVILKIHRCSFSGRTKHIFLFYSGSWRDL